MTAKEINELFNTEPYNGGELYIDQQIFEILIRDTREQTAIEKKSFLNSPSIDLKKDPEALFRLVNSNTLIFEANNDLVKSKLTAVGLDKFLIKRDLDLANIILQLEKLERNNHIQILKTGLLQAIILYQKYKLQLDIVKWLKFYRKYDRRGQVSEFSIEVNKFLKRKEYSAENSELKYNKRINDQYQELTELLLTNIYAYLKPLIPSEKLNKIFKQFANGTIELYILGIAIVKNIYFYPSFNLSDKKFGVTFDLFIGVLSTDFKILNEVEFNEGEQLENYGNYGIYKNSTIKKCIFKITSAKQTK